MNLSNIVVLSIKGSDYCCISKSKTIIFLQNIDLTERSETL